MSTEFIKKCERYAELRAKLDAIQAEAAPIQAEVNELQAQILAEHPASGLGTSFRLANGAQIVVSEGMKVKAVDKGAVARWFIERGMTEMLSVHRQTLTDFCKQEAEKAAPLPDGIEVSSYKRLSLRNF